jgi:uncharacterized protein YndB with AHSA1/START domain
VHRVEGDSASPEKPGGRHSGGAHVLQAQWTEERILAKNELFIDVVPDRVFEVLADAHSYEHWVVGAKRIRHADSGWPEPGTRLHHSLGVGPLTLNDNTKVIESDPPHHLVLEARGRPFGIAHIEFNVKGERGGSRVELHEWLVEPRLLAALNPVFAPLIRLRNTETLRRLTSVVMSMGPTGAGA